MPAQKPKTDLEKIRHDGFRRRRFDRSPHGRIFNFVMAWLVKYEDPINWVIGAIMVFLFVAGICLNLVR